MKGMIAVMLCALMAFGLAGCGFIEQTPVDSDASSGVQEESLTSPDSTEESTPPTDEPDEPSKPSEPSRPSGPTETTTITSLNPDTEGIKILGERYYAPKGEPQINCDWTCSGIEFVLDSLGGDVVFQAGSNKPCYFRAYVNGVEWKNGDSDYYTVDGRCKITLKDVPAGEQTIRLIKVTGILLSNAQLYSVSYKGEIVVDPAPADKDVYIEFLGDSISCGWGVVGPKDYTYTAQDGSLAYPYMLSQRLDVDYSILGLSGQGVIHHSAPNPNMTDGYLMAAPLRNDTASYSFSRQADVVVVNIGTNDYTYRESSGITEQSFAEAYKNLLLKILEKNGSDCKIVCLYNTMNDTFGDAIPNVCNELSESYSGIYSFKMNRTSGEGTGGHPTVAENVAYTDALESFIRTVIESENVPDDVPRPSDENPIWTPFV